MHALVDARPHPPSPKPRHLHLFLQSSAEWRPCNARCGFRRHRAFTLCIFVGAGIFSNSQQAGILNPNSQQMTLSNRTYGFTVQKFSTDAPQVLKDPDHFSKDGSPTCNPQTYKPTNSKPPTPQHPKPYVSTLTITSLIPDFRYPKREVDKTLTISTGAPVEGAARAVMSEAGRLVSELRPAESCLCRGLNNQNRVPLNGVYNDYYKGSISVP